METFIKKYKGEVSNANLLELGYAKGFIPPNVTFTRFAKLSAEASGHDPHVELTTLQNCVVIFDNQQTISGDLIVTNWQTGLKNTSASEYAYYLLNVYKSTDLTGMFEDVGSLPASDVVIAINLFRNNEYSNHGSIDTFGTKYPELMRANFTYHESRVYGNIKNLGGCIKLNALFLQGTAGITGSIEEVADAMLANGRSSGTLAITCNGAVTYNGSVVPNNTTKTITFNSGSYTVS